MHPMFVAGIITGSALLTFSLVSRNHIETMCTRSATSIGIILVLMGLVLAVQYYGTSRDYGVWASRISCGSSWGGRFLPHCISVFVYFEYWYCIVEGFCFLRFASPWSSRHHGSSPIMTSWYGLRMWGATWVH